MCFAKPDEITLPVRCAPKVSVRPTASLPGQVVVNRLADRHPSTRLSASPVPPSGPREDAALGIRPQPLCDVDLIFVLV
jgi:hypothetical protein